MDSRLSCQCCRDAGEAWYNVGEYDYYRRKFHFSEARFINNYKQAAHRRHVSWSFKRLTPDAPASFRNHCREVHRVNAMTASIGISYRHSIDSRDIAAPLSAHEYFTIYYEQQARLSLHIEAPAHIITYFIKYYYMLRHGRLVSQSEKAFSTARGSRGFCSMFRIICHADAGRYCLLTLLFAGFLSKHTIFARLQNTLMKKSSDMCILKPIMVSEHTEPGTYWSSIPHRPSNHRAKSSGRAVSLFTYIRCAFKSVTTVTHGKISGRHFKFSKSILDDIIVSLSQQETFIIGAWFTLFERTFWDEHWTLMITFAATFSNYGSNNTYRRFHYHYCHARIRALSL